MTKPGEEEPTPRKRRLSISVDRGVGEEFAHQAGLTGRPLYSFANDWLSAASKIAAGGGTAYKTEEEWKVLSVFKDVEVVPLPADFVGQIIEGLCRADRAKALTTFAALGDSLVNLLKIYAPDIDQLSDLAKGFAGIVPLKKLDIERISGESIVLSVVGAGKKYEVTECAFEFVKAVLAGYGYSVTAYELGVGTIRAEAKRRGHSPRPKAEVVPA